MELTHSAGLVPNFQGVASPTNRENEGGQSDATAGVMMGGGVRTPIPTETKTGGGRTGSGGYVLVLPPKLGEIGTGILGGGVALAYG